MIRYKINNCVDDEANFIELQELKVLIIWMTDYLHWVFVSNVKSILDLTSLNNILSHSNFNNNF